MLADLRSRQNVNGRHGENHGTFGGGRWEAAYLFCKILTSNGFVVLSGGDGAVAIRISHARDGAIDFPQKPFSAPVLLKKIEEVLQSEPAAEADRGSESGF